MTIFSEATAVTSLGEGRYRAGLDEAFGFETRPGGPVVLNGGYLMAVLMRAAVAESSHAHPVSTAVNFLRPGLPGPAEVVVERRKDGRTASMLRASLVQNGEALLDALVTTGTLVPAAKPVYLGEAPAPMPAPEDCPTRGRERPKKGFPANVDMRFDPAVMGWLDGSPTGRPEMRAHVRLAGGDHPDPYVVALAIDSLIPVVTNAGFPGWSPTVELTWHLRTLPAPGWLTVHGTGRMVSEGWCDEDVEVWDAAGNLVAQSRQLARAARTRE
ncbi:thioesterase family protein [Actinocorallia aurantiaca]|uniref:Thioesterase family protein n=1 Tax=Actinocorallia aurantiaca TaxID=46204 RepID=A0ABN3TYG9_9ACTN